MSVWGNCLPQDALTQISSNFPNSRVPYRSMGGRIYSQYSLFFTISSCRTQHTYASRVWISAIFSTCQPGQTYPSWLIQKFHFRICSVFTVERKQVIHQAYSKSTQKPAEAFTHQHLHLFPRQCGQPTSLQSQTHRCSTRLNWVFHFRMQWTSERGLCLAERAKRSFKAEIGDDHYCTRAGISQNHGIIEIGRDLLILSGPSPLYSSRVSYSRLSRTMSTWVRTPPQRLYSLSGQAFLVFHNPHKSKNKISKKNGIPCVFICDYCHSGSRSISQGTTEESQSLSFPQPGIPTTCWEQHHQLCQDWAGHSAAPAPERMPGHFSGRRDLFRDRAVPTGCNISPNFGKQGFYFQLQNGNTLITVGKWKNSIHFGERCRAR